VHAKLVVLFLLALPFPSLADDSARIIRVIDGDTVEAEINGEFDRIRLLRINTPEMTDTRPDVLELARASRLALERLVLNHVVTLEYDRVRRDKYGRILAHLHRADGLWVNREMVRLGFAEIMTIPPNVKHTDELLAAEREAREGKRGLWRD